MESAAGIAYAYVGAGLAIGIGAIGTGAGLGYTAREATRGMARQPGYSGDLLKTMLLGQAMTETPTIFALVVAILLVLPGEAVQGFSHATAMLGAGLAMGLGALGSGYGSGMVGGGAAAVSARNPSQGTQAMLTMFIAQALVQTPVIFALFVSVLLLFGDLGYEEADSFADHLVIAARALGAAISMGAGAIGPAYGTAVAGESATKGVARFPENSGVITRTMLVGMGVSQTTSIYALLVALLLLFVV